DGTVQTVTSTGVVTGTGEPFRAGTSPSIAATADGGAVTAWQDPNNVVATLAPGTGVTHTRLTMVPGSSPSIGTPPSYDPVHCQSRLIMCDVADVNGDGASDAVGIIDHSPDNHGWQGRRGGGPRRPQRRLPALGALRCHRLRHPRRTVPAAGREPRHGG